MHIYCIVTKSCISRQTDCTKLRALEKSVCSVPSKKCVLLWSSGETDPTQYIWTLVVASLLHPRKNPGQNKSFLVQSNYLTSKSVGMNCELNRTRPATYSSLCPPDCAAPVSHSTSWKSQNHNPQTNHHLIQTTSNVRMGKYSAKRFFSINDKYINRF